MARHYFLAGVMVCLSIVPMYGVQEQRHAQDHMQMGMMRDCPMNVQGAEVAVADVDGGVRLTITTRSGDVAELRGRVERMFTMHAAEGKSAMHGKAIPFTAKYEEVPGGAGVTLTPNDQARLADFRTLVRQHAERMKAGECSMMQSMMGGLMGNAEPQRKPTAADEENHDAHHPEGARQ